MTDGMFDSLIGRDEYRRDHTPDRCYVGGCKRPTLMEHDYKLYCSYHYDKFVKSGKIKEPKKYEGIVIK